MTLHQLLNGKAIANVYDGRPDGSILIRLEDRTEIVIFDGVLRSDDVVIRTAAPAETIAEATLKYDALLKKLADMPTNQPAASTDDPFIAEEADLEADLAEAATKQPAPPVVVEMRVWKTNRLRDYWQWDCCLGGLVIAMREYYVSCATPDGAKTAGDAWLAALSEQLGVPLVAMWEGEEPKTTDVSELERQERMKSGLPR